MNAPAEKVEKQRPGRPTHYVGGRQRINIELPKELVAALDVVVQELRERGERLDDLEGTTVVPTRTSYLTLLLDNDAAIKRALRQTPAAGD